MPPTLVVMPGGGWPVGTKIYIPVDLVVKHYQAKRHAENLAMAAEDEALKTFYENERVLNDAGILFDEVNVDKKVKESNEKVKTLKDMSIKELNDTLSSSISDENYEFAARVRDEIKKRN